MSGPVTRPAWVEVRVSEQAPPWEFHAKMGQDQARLMVGQVFNEDSVSVRVMRTQQDLVQAEKGDRAWAGVHALGRGAAGLARTLLLFAVKQKHEGRGNLGLAWPQFVKPGDSC